MGDHYFTVNPESDVRTQSIPVVIAGRDVTLKSANGVFSPSALDKGTSVLLRTVPPPAQSGRLLDIGCGWGPIALTLATLSPNAEVWAVDVNERARELTRRNAEILGLANVRVCAPDEVPEGLTFTTIWANPPIRVGKGELHGILERWLPRLEAGCDAWLVVSKNLGADSLQRWLHDRFDASHSVSREDSSKGFRVLRVQARDEPVAGEVDAELSGAVA